MKFLIAIGLAIATMSVAHADEINLTPEQEQKLASLPPDQQKGVREALQINNSLHPQHGDIFIPEANATLISVKDSTFYPQTKREKYLLMVGKIQKNPRREFQV